jgi:hypothetical protein
VGIDVRRVVSECSSVLLVAVTTAVTRGKPAPCVMTEACSHGGTSAPTRRQLLQPADEVRRRERCHEGRLASIPCSRMFELNGRTRRPNFGEMQELMNFLAKFSFHYLVTNDPHLTPYRRHRSYTMNGRGMLPQIWDRLSDSPRT